MVSKTIAKKEIHEKVKEEFLNSLRENDQVEEQGINIANMIEQGEAITIINWYEEKIKTQHKRVFAYVAKQG